MRRIFLFSIFTSLFVLVGCSTKQEKISYIRIVGFDTREKFDGVKFNVSLFSSNEGKGLVENLITGEKQSVVFNHTYRNGKRNKYVSFPKSIEDIEFARLSNGGVLYFNKGCETK